MILTVNVEHKVEKETDIIQAVDEFRSRLTSQLCDKRVELSENGIKPSAIHSAFGFSYLRSADQFFRARLQISSAERIERIKKDFGIQLLAYVMVQEMREKAEE